MSALLRCPDGLDLGRRKCVSSSFDDGNNDVGGASRTLLPRLRVSSLRGYDAPRNEAFEASATVLQFSTNRGQRRRGLLHSLS